MAGDHEYQYDSKKCGLICKGWQRYPTVLIHLLAGAPNMAVVHIATISSVMQYLMYLAGACMFAVFTELI